VTAAIVETLAKELSVEKEHAQCVFDLLSAGYKVPYIARFRRAEIGGFTDGMIRRFARRLKQFEELEKRRASLLRSIEEQARSGPAEPTDALQACMDRFELEDHFLPHRRPEPEVQLAIDRGLEALADALVAPAAPDVAVADESDAEADADAHEESSEPRASRTEAPEPAPGEEPESDPAPDVAAQDEGAGAEAPAESGEPAPLEENAHAAELEAGLDAQAESESEGAAGSSDSSEAPEEAGGGRSRSGRHEPEPQPARPVFHPTRIDLSPQLARLCAQYVNPDRGVHTEEQALEGAMRILSDRLGRNPALRSSLRRLLKKQGRVVVRPLVEESRLGRNRALLRMDVPLRQLQGHRLIALRQAQAQRMVAMHITVDEKLVLPKVRSALGRRIHPDYVSVAAEVARQALHLRLLPMIEDDVRNELRERADEEAIRLLAQNLRQMLLSPCAGPRPVAGVHADAKGDWVIVVVGPDGQPRGEERKIEASTLDLNALAQALSEALRDTDVAALAVAHGKESRSALQKLHEVIHLLQADACAFPVNETGLSSQANSEQARTELPTYSVPAREAIGLARRFQDPMSEFLKVDPRHLGLGREQAVVNKASLRRLIHDTIESCVAFVGCELNEAGVHFLRHLPGLNYELARKLVERRAERPFGSREELRTENLLDDVAWRNAIGFLRVRESSEPLDRTGLHPELYDLARRVIMRGGGSVEETLGQRDATRGLRRVDFDVDEHTWRDLIREIGFPGRDPRSRHFMPQLLPPDADTKLLQKDQVVEGIVSNVSSFGAFVYLGTQRDAMIHISEVSSHYVRDARALLSIGQVVRARVVSANGPRVELSLKNVPDLRRSGERGRGRNAERRERGERPPRRPAAGEAWPEHQPVMRAARTRRDGLVTGSGRDERRKGGGGKGREGGAGRAPSRGAAGGGRGRGGGRDDSYDPDAVRRASRSAGSYNPFASFFKQQPSDSDAEPPAAP